MRGIVICCCLVVAGNSSLLAQDIAIDTTLQEVIIEAYHLKRPLIKTAASVALVTAEQIERFGNWSALPAMNAVAGVRMEERSPSSFRFAIRGSAIRSPFGVRNVKVYWNDLPFTDAGGNTYLNLLDVSTINKAEIIKGPAGSMYGAGTGGALLLESERPKGDGIHYEYTRGSFNRNRHDVGAHIHSEKFAAAFRYVDHRSDNYRQHSQSDMQSLLGNVSYTLSEKHELDWSLLYTDLYYQTPGSLTRDQFQADPRQARPSAATPGAVEKKAAVFNNTLFSGLTHQANWSSTFETTNSVYGAKTDFRNPSIREYEERDENNLGVRSITTKRFSGDQTLTSVSAGGEYQRTKGPIVKAVNDGGKKGMVNTRDEITSDLALLFAQADIEWRRWILTLGASGNFVRTKLHTKIPVDDHYERQHSPVVLPRIALLHNVGSWTWFGSVAKGFSPPTLADLLPSGGTFNRGLKPETGINAEVGLRGSFRKINMEFVAYQFALSNTIVRRVTEQDVEYFVNAGKTMQRGIESSVSWTVVDHTSGPLRNVRIFATHAYQHYRFNNYQIGVTDVSGKKLTGVPPSTVFAGADVAFRNRVTINLSYHYVDHVPLNDDNSVFASEYSIIAVRAAYDRTIGTARLKFFAGTDNLLNRRYSLGNDLNAVGGRYYNVAPARNFYLGCRFDLDFVK